jgi:hypothetical protein
MKVLNLGQVAPTCKIIIPYMHVPSFFFNPKTTTKKVVLKQNKIKNYLNFFFTRPGRQHPPWKERKYHAYMHFYKKVNNNQKKN